MEKDWYHQQHPPNLNLSGHPFGIGLPNSGACKSDYFRDDSTFGTVPPCPVPWLQLWKTAEPNNSFNWFQHMPNFHQEVIPAPKTASKEKFSAGLVDFRQLEKHKTDTYPTQKRFLVFDQSGEKTTLIYSSGVETPVQFGASWTPKPPTTYNLSKESPVDSMRNLRPITDDEHVDNKLGDDAEDELHEDTEELNALLYSDSDSYGSEDDEETSTGHSPSTMTDNGIPNLVEETGEEVDSFAGPTKRQKLLDGGYSDINTASFVKTHASSTLEDDAESSSSNSNKLIIGNVCSSSSMGKRSRKESIRETLNVLQSIIPGVNGKDAAVVVIDEAIHYLRSLKVKAKALGLDTF